MSRICHTLASCFSWLENSVLFRVWLLTSLEHQTSIFCSTFGFLPLSFHNYPIAVIIDSCFYPDGTVATVDVPCNTIAPLSACCGDGWACSSNGVCISLNPGHGPGGHTNLPVRGSCTDLTWRSEFCPQFCTTGRYAFAPTEPKSWLTINTPSVERHGRTAPHMLRNRLFGRLLLCHIQQQRHCHL